MTVSGRKEGRNKRKLRVRAKVSGSAKRPRMAVFCSNHRLYVQLVDDEKRHTLVSGWIKGKNLAAGKALGSEIAKKAKEKGITTVVFDRGGFRYHGVVAALADAAREGGLKF